MLFHDLQQLGFSKNIAAVYIALLELREAKGGDIIHKTGLHRHLVYTALSSLEEKKLVMKTERRGVALFKLLNPERILHELQHKAGLAEQIVEEVRKKYRPNAQEVVVYEGTDDLRQKEVETFEKLKSQEICYLGVSPAWLEVMGLDTANRLARLQRQHNLSIRAIASKPTPEMASFLVNKALTRIKYLNNLTPPNSETHIFSDRVVIKVFVAPYVMIEIINAAVAASYRQYFEGLWKISNSI